MLIKTGKGLDLQLPFLNAAEQGRLDIDALCAAAAADEECFTLPEFLEFQAKGLAKLVDDRERRTRNRRRGRKAVTR